jgi:hypothetical protein
VVTLAAFNPSPQDRYQAGSQDVIIPGKQGDLIAPAAELKCRRDNQPIVHLTNRSQGEGTVEYRSVKRDQDDASISVHVGQQMGNGGNPTSPVLNDPAGFRQCNGGKEQLAGGIREHSSGIGAQPRVRLQVPDEGVGVYYISTAHRPQVPPATRRS